MPTKHGGSGWLFRGTLLGTLGVAVAGSTLALAINTRADFAFFDPIIDVKALISRHAALPPDDEALQRAAIEGMLSALDDQYASYIPAELESEFNKRLLGEYVGIGAEIMIRDGVLHIVSPLDDSPAFRAGVLAGDDVIAIDGEPTAGITVEGAVERLTGEPGTGVVLTVERDGRELDIEITRGFIQTKAVRGFERDNGPEGGWRYVLDEGRGVAYVRLSQFTPSSADEFRDVLVGLGAERGELSGLILDLRSNPGGVLQAAVSMADLLLREGVIVSTRGRAHPEEIARARAAGTLPEFPVAVLLNGRSASASEVLAGALAENDRAVVIGTRSFGKGSVQTVHSLTGSETGAKLKLTEQRYYLPSGRSIQRQEDAADWGVDPTPGFFVPMSDAELRTMLEIQRERAIARARGGEPSLAEDAGADRSEPDWSDPDWVEDVLSDPQLAAAIRAVRTRVETGAWRPVTDAESGFDAVLAEELTDLRANRTRLLRAMSRLDERIANIEAGTDDATADAAEARVDLIPGEPDLRGGELVVVGPSGEELARLRIVRDDLENWLVDAPLETPAGAPAGTRAGPDGVE